MTPRLLITGTNTGVGKTFITCRIARELQAALFRTANFRVGIYKPVCSGADTTPQTNTAPQTNVATWPDVEQLSNALGNQFPIDAICPQRFIAPMAPPSAASLEDRTVDDELLISGINYWDDKVDLLLVEGVGGLLCPLSELQTVADFAVSLQAPLLIVAAAELGMINHTLLTIEAAVRRNLTVAGVVVNMLSPTIDTPLIVESIREIQRQTQHEIPIWGVVPYDISKNLQTDTPEADHLQQQIINSNAIFTNADITTVIDWKSHIMKQLQKN